MEPIRFKIKKPINGIDKAGTLSTKGILTTTEAVWIRRLRRFPDSVAEEQIPEAESETPPEAKKGSKATK